MARLGTLKYEMRVLWLSIFTPEAYTDQLVERMGETIAKEARALGVTQLFAPVLDLAREPRYGRVSLRSAT